MSTGHEQRQAARLEAEMLRRLWTLYDAAKVISEQGDRATVDAWAALYVAVANVPESALTGTGAVSGREYLTEGGECDGAAT